MLTQEETHKDICKNVTTIEPTEFTIIETILEVNRVTKDQRTFHQIMLQDPWVSRGKRKGSSCKHPK
jgi:hypothetical protein